MIPTLPSSVSDKDQLEFLSTLAGNLSDQSSIHINWHTHRQNPSVCWICDLNVLVSRILFYTKSSLDMETEISSDDESDTEIECEWAKVRSLNYDEEIQESLQEKVDEEPVADL